MTMRSITARLAMALALCAGLSAVPAAAQDSGQQDGEDIVVTGERPVEDLPVQTDEGSIVSIGTKQAASEVERFSRCARTQPAERLRKILDERPNSPGSEGALHDYVVRNQGCLDQVPRPLPARPYFGVCEAQIVDQDTRTTDDGTLQITSAPITVCRSVLRRGLLYQQAVLDHADTIPFTQNALSAPGVLDRFLAREDYRNATRGGPKSTFFFAVACMVRVRPDYALRLLESERGSALEDEMRARLIGNGQACVGGAEDVQVDSDQFRAFAAEAVYGWMTAISGRQTLVEES